MSRFYIKSLDLNLLTVFLFLWDTRSVSRTSERLALTQPAISHALKRLRDRLGDPLFVSGRHGLVPTARAADLINPVRQALGQIERAVANDAEFAPMTAQREFRIATVDPVEIWLFPGLMEQIHREAPEVRVRSVPIPTSSSAQAVLEAGDIDVIIGSHAMIGAGVRCEPLVKAQFHSLIWDREKIRGKRIPLRLYLERPHVIFDTRDRIGSVVDQALAAQGHSRKIGAVVQSVISMPAVAARTGYICTVPDGIAYRFAAPFGLNVYLPPIDIPPVPFFHAWHARFDSDLALTWLREKMQAAVATLGVV